MSAAQTPSGAAPGANPAPGTGAGNDPSMEDILASIRRILSEEEPAPTPSGAEPDEKSDDVLVLDSSMLVIEEPPPAVMPAPPPPPPVLEAPTTPAPPPPMPTPTPVLAQVPELTAALVAPEAAAAAATSMGSLLRTLAAQQSMQVHRGGPTIEDIVREEMRPLLKQWLDTNLPEMVERLVHAEIERVIGQRSVP